MNKKDLLLVALSAGDKYLHTPVQIQKLLFLIEKNVSTKMGGPFFQFVPYDYGPFDVSVYETLNELEHDGDVVSSLSPRGWKYHSLTEQGIKRGAVIRQALPADVGDYIDSASKFVRNLSFAELVSAIYKAYPEMKEKSVFRA